MASSELSHSRFLGRLPGLGCAPSALPSRPGLGNFWAPGAHPSAWAPAQPGSQAARPRHAKWAALGAFVPFASKDRFPLHLNGLLPPPALRPGPRPPRCVPDTGARAGPQPLPAGQARAPAPGAPPAASPPPRGARGPRRKSRGATARRGAAARAPRRATKAGPGGGGGARRRRRGERRQRPPAPSFVWRRRRRLGPPALRGPAPRRPPPRPASRPPGKMATPAAVNPPGE